MDKFIRCYVAITNRVDAVKLFFKKLHINMHVTEKYY